MGKIQDLTNQKFNHLTAKYRGEDYITQNGQHMIQWWCECDCGNPEFILVARNNLKSGHTKSCGCLKKISGNFEDISGQIFGRWHVVKRGDNLNGKAQWWCWCDCQKDLLLENRELHLLTTAQLKSGRSLSCGCYAKELLSLSKKKNINSLQDHSIDNDDFWKYKPKENVKTCNNGSVKIRKRYYETGDIIKHYPGKYYYYDCNICGYKSDDLHIILESNLASGHGCPNCSGRLITYNSDTNIANSAPWLVQCLVNKEDAYNYGISSNEKLLTKCICCGYEENKKISSMYHNGYHCKKCSDGISYPEKFMEEVLIQLGIQYTTQLSKKEYLWINKYRYDFYLKDYNMIIEVHGGQHYYDGFTIGRSLKEEQENDKNKKELALSNGIDKYIIIDCRYSTMKWVSENIIKELKLYFDFTHIDFIKCAEAALKTKVKEVCDYYCKNDILKTFEHFSLHDSTIRKYLKQGSELGWCEYKTRPLCRKIIVYKDGEFIGKFNKIKDFVQFAKDQYGVTLRQNSVSSVCSGRYKHTKGFVCSYIDN